MLALVTLVAVLSTGTATSVTITPEPADLWQWFVANVSVQGGLNIAGLTLLVILFARDLVLTKGQHLRRVEDLVKSHTALLAASEQRYNDMVAQKDEEYARMQESRNYYRDAYNAHEVRKQKLTDVVIEQSEALQVAARAFGALEQAVPPEGQK